MSDSLQADSLQSASVKDKITNALNTYTPLLRENFKSTFVSLQSGKSLSTNDFTNAYKTKLDSIQAGAQVNIIENISVNGVNASIDNKTAKISITGGTDLTINGDTVQAVTLTGADYDYDSDTKTASISVGSGLENFTVNGAAVTSMSVVGAASVTSDSDTKTALISITGGSGGAVTLNNHTIKSASIVGADVDFDSLGNAGITISSADALTLNGSTICSASIVGASVNVDSLGNAVVSISSGSSGINKVSVTGGDLHASISGSTLYLFNSESTPKADSGFSISSSANSFYVDQPVTVSADRLGSGIITPVPNNNLEVVQLNATDFEVTPTVFGAQSLGFVLSETEQYYGASTNFDMEVETPLVVLMHFDSAADSLRNDGTAVINNISSPTLVTISSDYGKWNSGLGIKSSTNAIYSSINFNTTDEFKAPIGGGDFTCDFWAKDLRGTDDCQYFGIDFLHGSNNSILFHLFRYGLNESGYYTLNFNNITNSTTKAVAENNLRSTIADLPNSTTRMNHYAFVYTVDDLTWRMYYNGILHFYQANKPFGETFLKSIQVKGLALDELRILNGVAAWTSDFTPPSAPY